MPGPSRVGRRQSLGRQLTRSTLVVALAGTACLAPDRPTSLPTELPAAALELLGPAVERRTRLGPGIVFRTVVSPRGPWRVYMLELDLSLCHVALDVVSADGEAWGRARVSEMATIGIGTVAAVNGGFFTPEGQPLGLEVSAGRVSARGARPALAWRPGRTPWIGVPRADGDSILMLGWPVPLGNPDGLTEALAGFPELLRSGEPVGDLGRSENPGFSVERHPRTAVGISPDGLEAWVVVVDGRQEGYSEGMTLPEVARLMKALGATAALNLDGGGSSVMTVGAVRVNRPSDASGEREVANALVIRRDPSACRSS